jgi:hypothetical protein
MVVRPGAAARCALRRLTAGGRWCRLCAALALRCVAGARLFLYLLCWRGRLGWGAGGRAGGAGGAGGAFAKPSLTRLGFVVIQMLDAYI